jgi:hypothetical protein
MEYTVAALHWSKGRRAGRQQAGGKQEIGGQGGEHEVRNC